MNHKKVSVPEFTYKKLPDKKIKNGYIYKLIKRNDKVAIYQQSEINGNVVGYEVFKIVITKPYSIIQKHGSKKGQVYHYPAAEKFPGNEDGGKILWCYNTLTMAMKKFEELSK